MRQLKYTKEYIVEERILGKAISYQVLGFWNDGDTRSLYYCDNLNDALSKIRELNKEDAERENSITNHYNSDGQKLKSLEHRIPEAPANVTMNE